MSSYPYKKCALDLLSSIALKKENMTIDSLLSENSDSGFCTHADHHSVCDPVGFVDNPRERGTNNGGSRMHLPSSTCEYSKLVTYVERTRLHSVPTTPCAPPIIYPTISCSRGGAIDIGGRYGQNGATSPMSCISTESHEETGISSCAGLSLSIELEPVILGFLCLWP